MNIFVLDSNPILAARYHCDKHIVKMCLETAQILCSVRHRYNDGTDNIPYKETHKNHPCVLWTGKTVANYNWLLLLGKHLCEEYQYRYGKIHKCQAVIEESSQFTIISNMCQNGLLACQNMTPFVLAMPEYCKTTNPVESYRNYYRKEKAYMCKWTKRLTPFWF